MLPRRPCVPTANPLAAARRISSLISCFSRPLTQLLLRCSPRHFPTSIAERQFHLIGYCCTFLEHHSSKLDHLHPRRKSWKNFIEQLFILPLASCVSFAISFFSPFFIINSFFPFVFAKLLFYHSSLIYMRDFIRDITKKL